MTAVFSDYLDQQKTRIGNVIDASLSQFKAEDWDIIVMMGQEKYKSLFDEHWDIITDYPSRRGKYLRPALVMLMAEAMSGSSEKAVFTATAMQMSEDWILIHDDWEDGSLERRGKPALHRLVSSEISVNAGDTLHECMHRVLSENFRLLDVSLARRVQREFFLMLGRTTFGQYAEIKWTQDNKQDMTDEDVLFTVSGKTVYYTVAGPLRLGAILAGATDEQLQRIYAFSYPLGLCFQIRDDVLDLTGDFEGQKKQSLNDIYEGKRTLILLHLLRHCTDDERQRVEAILGKPREQKTAGEVQYIRDLMDVYGSIRYAESCAEAYARDALDRLSTIDFIQESYRPLFCGMVDFILRRGR
ncbi:MAG: polyprenyl synthetase family protein [Prevotella sp.]|nr:polyprenyl synthetase family protein [Prevotella sp.]